MDLSKENGSIFYRLYAPYFTSPITSSYYLSSKDMNIVLRLKTGNVLYCYDKSTAFNYTIKILKRKIQQYKENAEGLSAKEVERKVQNIQQQLVSIFYGEV